MQEITKGASVFLKNGLVHNFHIEAESVKNGLSLFVYGVTSVRSFSKEEVHLRSGKSGVKVFGSNLSISVYDGKALEILGEVSRIELV